MFHSFFSQTSRIEGRFKYAKLFAFYCYYLLPTTVAITVFNIGFGTWQIFASQKVDFFLRGLVENLISGKNQENKTSWKFRGSREVPVFGKKFFAFFSKNTMFGSFFLDIIFFFIKIPYSLFKKWKKLRIFIKKISV